MTQNNKMPQNSKTTTQDNQKSGNGHFMKQDPNSNTPKKSELHHEKKDRRSPDTMNKSSSKNDRLVPAQQVKR